MKRNGEAPAVDVAGWRTMDENARRIIVEQLRPHMRAIATELGAKSRAERRDVLEAVGLASLRECGWTVLAARPDNDDPRRYL